MVINTCIVIEIPLYPNYHLRKPDSFDNIQLRWEFIKENKKVRNQDKKKKRTRPRKRSRKKENKNSTKKVIKKKRKYFLFFLVVF